MPTTITPTPLDETAERLEDLVLYWTAHTANAGTKVATYAAAQRRALEHAVRVLDAAGDWYRAVAALPATDLVPEEEALRTAILGDGQTPAPPAALLANRLNHLTRVACEIADQMEKVA